MRILFVIVVALLPVIPAANIGSWDLSFIRLFVPLLAVGAAAVFLWKRNIPIPAHPVFWAACAFLGIAGLSFLWAQEPSFALRKFIFLAGLFPGIWLGAVWASHRRLFALGIAIAGIGAAFAASMQAVFGAIFGADAVMRVLQGVGPFLWGRKTSETVFQFPSFFVDLGQPVMRAFFPFPDPHTLSLFLGMALFCMFGFWGLAGRRAQPFFVLGLVLILLAIVLSFSRGGYIALIAGGAMFVALSWRSVAERARKLILLSFVMVIVITVAAPSVRDRFVSSFDVHEGSVAGRLALWRDTAGVFLEAPVLGVGLGGLAHTLSPAESFRVPTNAHNTYLEIAAELGIAGLLFFASIVALALFAFARQKDALARGFAAAVAVFAVQSFLETTLFSPQVFVVFGLLVGIAAGSKNTTKYESVRIYE